MSAVATLSPAQKAAATRRARKDAAQSQVTGFCDPAALASLGDADLLSLFSTVGDAVSNRFLRGRECLSSCALVLGYLKSAMAFESNEQFRVLFLDKKNKLIADEVMQRGTIDHVPVYPREVAKRALELGATAIILSHNHPSGDPTPSRADVEMTKTLRDTLKPLGVAIHDHVIVGRDGHLSMKAGGLF